MEEFPLVVMGLRLRPSLRRFLRRGQLGGEFQHSINGRFGSADEFRRQFHFGRQCFQASAEFAECVSFHVFAFIASAGVGGGWDEFFVGAFFFESVEHSGFGGDDDCLGVGFFAVADHFLRGANLVCQQPHGFCAFWVGNYGSVWMQVANL